MVALNKQYYGVRTIEQLIREVPAGRDHLLQLDEQPPEPAPQIVGALQRDPAALEDPDADLDRPGAGRGAAHRAAGHGPPREHGARRDPSAGTLPAGSVDHRRGAAGDGYQRRRRASRGRERQPAERSGRDSLVRRPSGRRLRLRVTGGARATRRSRHDRRGGDGEALPRPRRHDDQQRQRQVDLRADACRGAERRTSRRSRRR